jgi:hypothetical protein
VWGGGGGEGVDQAECMLKRLYWVRVAAPAGLLGEWV